MLQPPRETPPQSHCCATSSSHTCPRGCSRRRAVHQTLSLRTQGRPLRLQRRRRQCRGCGCVGSALRPVSPVLASRLTPPLLSAQDALGYTPRTLAQLQPSHASRAVERALESCETRLAAAAAPFDAAAYADSALNAGAREGMLPEPLSRAYAALPRPSTGPDAALPPPEQRSSWPRPSPDPPSLAAAAAALASHASGGCDFDVVDVSACAGSADAAACLADALPAERFLRDYAAPGEEEKEEEARLHCEEPLVCPPAHLSLAAPPQADPCSSAAPRSRGLWPRLGASPPPWPRCRLTSLQRRSQWVVYKRAVREDAPAPLLPLVLQGARQWGLRSTGRLSPADFLRLATGARGVSGCNDTAAEDNAALCDAFRLPVNAPARRGGAGAGAGPSLPWPRAPLLYAGEARMRASF